MEIRKRFSRVVAMVLLLTFFVWQVTPYSYAAAPANNAASGQWIDPEVNPQTPVMTPETSTTPGEEAYIEGYGPNDVGMVTELLAEDETNAPLSIEEVAITKPSEIVPVEVTPNVVAPARSRSVSGAAGEVTPETPVSSEPPAADDEMAEADQEMTQVLEAVTASEQIASSDLPVILGSDEDITSEIEANSAVAATTPVDNDDSVEQGVQEALGVVNPLSDISEVVVTSTIPAVTNQASLTVSYIVGGTVQARTFSLVEGINHIVLEGQNAAGQPISQTFDVELDTVPPVLALEGDVPEVLPIDSLFVTYTVDGESRMIVLPLEEGDNTDLQITAMDAAGNESVLRLPNVRYEKPPAMTAENASRNLGSGTESGDDQRQGQGTPVSLADFRAYLQTRNMSLLQRSRVNQSLGLVSAGAFVYRYETASGMQYSWTESTGRTVVFSFENNTLLFGELLTRILS